MATTANYLSFADRLNVFGTDGNRVDANALTTHWRVVNATARPTDIPDGMIDIGFYGLEILPTNADPLTVFIDGVLLSDTETLREMLFHAQVKCSQDLSIVTALHESGQPLGELEPIGSAIPREQFSPVRSNIFTVPANSGEKFASVELTISNHGANAIYLTVPALINHLDFYRNAYVRSARNYIPDIYWSLDFDQSDPQYPMYKLLDTLTHASDDVMQLFSNWFDHELDELSAGYTGEEDWTQSTLTSGELATETNFDWLSQFTGGELKGNIVGTDEPAGTVRDFYTTSDQITAFLRWQLENSYYGRAAGTREAMIAAAQQVLSGAKGVAIIPHHGADPWKIQVQTLRSETQDFDASTYSSNDVLDAVAAAAPMGYEIFHLAVLFFAFTLGNVGLGRLGLGVLGGPGGYVPPDAPTGLTITAGGTPSTMLILTWVAPLYNGGNAVSGYLIRRNGSIIVANTGNTNVTYTDTGRTPGTAYSYTVAAINGAGAGTQSTSASGTTDAIVPNAPTGLTLAAGSTPSSMIDLTWVAPAYTGGAAIIGYRITENNVVVVNNTGSSTVTLTRSGLSRATAYTYKVAALNAAGTGADSSAVALTTAAELPDAPGTLALSVGNPAQNNILLTWSAPSDNGGGAITGYRIKKNGSTIVADTGGTATTYVASSLTRYTQYNFTVAAINSAGTGTDGNTPSLYTYPDLCVAPTLTATADPAAVAVNLSWTIPNAGGGTISGYHIKRDGSTVVANTGNTNTTYADTGLALNTTYSYTVAAINQAGDGTFSSADTAKTITVLATGGDITYYGTYKVHTFTGSANLVVSSSVSGTVTADVLVVSGGGSSDSPQWGYQKAFCTGGAGGGGVVESTQVLAASTNYFCTVGAGGTASTNNTGTHGGYGSFSSQGTVYGGGKADSYQSAGTATLTNGGGGQGGGARVSAYYGTFEEEWSGLAGSTHGQDGGDGKCGTVTAGQHYTYGGGGGGGGSGGSDGDDATDAVTGPGGDGGDGMQNNYQTGSNQYYAGGGGGAGQIGGQMANCEVPSAAAVGGQGGGGTGGHSTWSTTNPGGGSSDYCGSNYVTDATDGTANTGGGGGGGGEGSFNSVGSSYHRDGPDGGAGGSGIVIVRYVHIRP